MTRTDAESVTTVLATTPDEAIVGVAAMAMGKGDKSSLAYTISLFAVGFADYVADQFAKVRRGHRFSLDFRFTSMVVQLWGLVCADAEAAACGDGVVGGPTEGMRPEVESARESAVGCVHTREGIAEFISAPTHTLRFLREAFGSAGVQAPRWGCRAPLKNLLTAWMVESR